MKILFIGPKFGNSYLLFKTFKKKYKNIEMLDTKNILPYPKISIKIFYHISPYIFEKYINNKILNKIKKKYDLIFIKSGEIIGKKLILKLKKISKKIVFFCNDNPFVKRDKNRWKLFFASAKYYDVIAYQDLSRIKLAKKFRLKNSLLVIPPYDSEIHKKHKITLKDKVKHKNQVIFIGTWFPDRGFFFKRLIDQDIPIKIYGSRWDKDPQYEKIKSHISLGHIYEKNYSKLIQSSKIAICLFSKQNMDTITARSIEIPAIGTLLCSYKTKAMTSIYKENSEAIFFSDVDECITKCKFYLKNESLANKVAKKGKIKITKKMKVSSSDLIKNILDRI
jgi:spore maturation protein CgeB